MAGPRRRIIPVFIPNDGCEHDCVFCDQRVISGRGSPAGPDDVRKAYSLELSVESGEWSVECDGLSAQPAELAFYGGSFTAIPVERQNELLEAARPFLEMNPQNSIRVSTRPDCIDEKTVERLKSYGVATVELGAQSMSHDVLVQSRRGHTAEDVARASGIIKGAGLSLMLQMMTGLLGDTREKSLFTARRFTELSPDGVRVYPTVIVKGTELFNMWRRGEYSEHSLDEAVELCAEICAVFERAGVPVIRLGLNPSDALSAGDAVAGAYHPAFGELVYSRIYYNKAAALISGLMPCGEVTITVSKGSASKMAGQRRQNIRMLEQRFALRNIKIAESDLCPGEITVEKKPVRS